MSAFGSSAINKSNKKLAPRAPAQRRRAPVPSTQHEAATQESPAGAGRQSQSLSATEYIDSNSSAVGQHRGSTLNVVQPITEHQEVDIQQGDSESFVQNSEPNTAATFQESIAPVEQSEISTSSYSQTTAPGRPSKRRRIQNATQSETTRPLETSQSQEVDASETFLPTSFPSNPELQNDSMLETGRGDLNISRAPYSLRNRSTSRPSAQTAESVPRPTFESVETRSADIPAGGGSRKGKRGAPRVRTANRKRLASPQRASEDGSESEVPPSRENSVERDVRISTQARGGKRKLSRHHPRNAETSNNLAHPNELTDQNLNPSLNQTENNLAEGNIPALENPEVVDESSLADDARRRRHRKGTPEGAEEAEIDTSTKRMFDLCKTSKLGKKSKLETEFQHIDWSEVARLRKVAEEQRRAGDVNPESSANQTQEQSRDQVRPLGPQLKIVNGQITIDNSSLMVSTHQKSNQIDEEIGNAVLETDLTKRINSRTWLNDTRRDPEERFRSTSKSQPWTEEETERFYDAIRMFGTDFYMISKMFPGRTRRHIKLKYVREERADLNRVDAALSNESVPMSMDKYCEATGQQEDTFKDPKELEDELQAEHEKQKADIEKQRKEQEEAQRQKQQAAAAKDGSKGNTNKKSGARNRKRKQAGAVTEVT